MTAADRDLMGMNGRNLTSQHFHWSRVAHKMAEVYRWMQGEGQIPSSVEVL